ncbi:alpha,alpha-trehalase [Pelomonas aquatica]|uniref:Alpha,alpha-trehalase n=1 Tax=Pelomonas aquatica TaxID=431058 RepID=A0ABU1Z9N6_9BURK|nr:alpha,alpha-trehalase TreF [Pelomonas aquatica]MDR7297335.1 alpha,alpha-trehalase [Pelomonas aquatica]
MATATPQALYGELFVAVQMARVFPDGKSFVDARPKAAPALIRARFDVERHSPGFSLADFVQAHFVLPGHDEPAGPRPTNPGHIRQHIRALWPLLVREHRTAAEGDSLLALPRPYVVPGGRFRELYYWDSYFTMLGLVADGRRDLAEHMLANFAHLIASYGFIPNSSRSYMLSRSQPPFFFRMVELLHADDPAAGFAKHLPSLQAEHAFWMDGEATLAPDHAHRRALRTVDGALLNRYWDDRDTPREESWREDVETAEASGRPHEQVWRDLRAGAESGWDFSGRWCADPADIATIETTALAPVDLNALLAGLEGAIALGAARAGDTATASAFEARAATRTRWLQTRFWRAKGGGMGGHFADLNWRNAADPRPLTAAALVPLYLGLATPPQADAMAAQVQRHLLGANGLLTTALATGQQWDAPNGWAPLQWMATQGLARYGHTTLARDIAQRWCASVQRVYLATGRLLEKYDVAEDRPGGGGEYETQDGFGWTNGVFVAFQDGLLEATAP